MTKSHRSQKQNGNMFIGLVLGLITGLAIAIAVALYITRSPSPVAPKNPVPEYSTPLNAAPSFDPNRPLQGNMPAEPVPQAPPDSTLDSALSEQAQDQSHDLPQAPLDKAQIIEMPPASSEPASGTRSETNRPSASSTASPSAHPRTSEAPGEESNMGYYLQVGAYKTRADAETQRAQLALQGFEAKVSRHDSGNIRYYRVRVGPLAQFDQMNNVRRQLSNVGIDTVVIRFHKE